MSISEIVAKGLGGTGVERWVPEEAQSVHRRHYSKVFCKAVNYPTYSYSFTYQSNVNCIHIVS